MSTIDLIGEDVRLINEILDNAITQLQQSYLKIYVKMENRLGDCPEREGYFMRAIEILELHTSVRLMSIPQRKHTINQLATEYFQLEPLLN